MSALTVDRLPPPEQKESLSLQARLVYVPPQALVEEV
jgi:hypothetical protein